MALVIKPRVGETSTVAGTGAATLAGALTAHQTFASVCSVNDTVYYDIEAVDASGIPTGEWEEGIGTYSGANTLTRTTPAYSSDGVLPHNFSAGAKYIRLIASADQIAAIAAATAGITSLSTSTSTGLSTATSGITSLSTSTSTGLSTATSGITSLSTSTSTGLSTATSSIVSLSTSTSTGLSTATSSIVSLSTTVSTGDSSLSTAISTTNSNVTSLSTTTSTSFANSVGQVAALPIAWV